GRVAVVYGKDSSTFVGALSAGTHAAGGAAASGGAAVSGSNGTVYSADGYGPAISSSVTADADADGYLDAVVFTFNEDVDSATVAGADFSVTGYTVSSASRTADSVITIVLTESGTADTDAVPLSSISGSISDLTANATTSGSTTPSDAAAAVFLSATTSDNDTDGQIDRILATFSEDISSGTVAGADFTATGYTVSSASRTADSVITIVLTESGSGDTDAVPSTSVVGSISDLVSSVTTSGTKTPTDAASPVLLSQNYKDTNTNGTIDRFDLTFSENIAYDECETGDYTIGGADVGSLAISACAASGDDLQLTVTGGATNDTNITVTVAYTAANGTANSLDDSTNNAVTNISAATLSDAASAIFLSGSTADSDVDGQIDRILATFSEDISSGSVAGSDFTVTGFTVSSASRTSDSVITIVLTESGADDTDAVPSTNIVGSVSDAASNATTSGTKTPSDAAAAVFQSATTADNDVDGQIDRIVLTFSEDITSGSVAGADFTVSGFTVSSASRTADSVITIVLTESGSADTDATPSTSVAGSLSDSASNTTASGTKTPSDAAIAVLLSGTTADNDTDGQIDRILLTFSEDITSGSVAGADFTVSGFTISSASRTSDSIVTIVFTESGTADTDATPLSSVSGSLSDGVGNTTTSGSTTPIDAASAVFLSATTADNDTDGQIDRILATFSEDISSG
ncbi:MAG: hypothetical protein AAB448_02590, partial [Patescibacteria group bacterium]